MATIDHVAEALTRFQQTLQDQPNLATFLTAHVAPIQDIEDALQDVLTERQVDTAIGDQLDMLGAIVGQPRDGLSDDDYRRYIRARIKTNRSRGTIPEIVSIAEFVINDPDAVIELTNWGVAAYDLQIGDILVTDELAAILLAFLQDATAAGVRPILRYNNNDPTIAFIWGAPSQNCWGEGNWQGAID